MSEVSNDSRIGQVRSEVDFRIVEENILDIAGFTVEKYESSNDTTLPPQVRREVIQKIQDALWGKVEELRFLRQQVLEMFFNKAEVTLNEVVIKKKQA